MASIMINWYDEFKDNFDKWENIGSRVLRDVLEDGKHERFKEVAKELDVLEDGKLTDYYEEQINSYSEPMMNYGHLLETEPSDEDVLKVVLNTNCSVMYNDDTNEYFIVLCGGGMDLSQDIALSYVWLERWIPEDLLMKVCRQPCLSLSEKKWKELKKSVIEQAEQYQNRFKRLKEDWEKTTLKDKV